MSKYTFETFHQHLSNQQFELDLKQIISFTGLKTDSEILEYLLVIRYEIFSILHQIQKSIDTKNREGLKKQVHSLKGLSNAVGFEPLSEMIRDADQNAFVIQWQEMQSIYRNTFLCYYQLRDQIEQFVCNNNLFTHLNLSSIQCLTVSNRHTIRNIISKILEKMGIERVIQTQSVHDALTEIENHTIDFVITTLELEGESGMGLLNPIRTNQTACHYMLPVFFIAGKTDEQHFREAIRQDIYGFTGKQMKQQLLAGILMRLNDYKHIPRDCFPSPEHYTRKETPQLNHQIQDEKCIGMSIYETPPGSILAEDITDFQNRVIFKRGYRLSPFDIDNLRDLTQFEGQYYQVHILQ